MTQWSGTGGRGDDPQAAWNCGQCRAYNRPGRSACSSCGWPRQSVAQGPDGPQSADSGWDSGSGPAIAVPPPAFALPPSPPTIYCFACGAQIDARAEICPKCGVRQQTARPGQVQVAPPVAATGMGYSVAAIICGVVALLFFPIIFGPAGLVLGAVAYTRHERLWAIGMAMALVGGLVGFFIGFLVAASRY